MADVTAEPEQVVDDTANRSVTLPSFQTVLGKNCPAVKEELSKKIRAKVDGTDLPSSSENLPQGAKETVEKKPEEQEKAEETHCVFFNKSCLTGPYLDPEKVASMPDFTAFAKPPAAVRFALEQVIDVATDPVEAMDAIQEGFCPKLFSKGKRKILKKGLFRFDTKLRAGRFLKRLCKKLKSCEYFLSFDPAKDPCPLECQTSGTTSLESFVAMKGMKAKGDPQTNHFDDLRRKRGRPRKDDFEMSKLDNHNRGDFNNSKDGWVSSVRNSVGMPVRVLNPTSYHGRPLVPIAPGAKRNPSPVSIMPAGSQLRHVRPPPPYEIDGRTSFVHPIQTNTIVTSATQPRMVAPVNLRMISPNTPTAALPGSDPSTPTFASQNLATVLVVTNPHSTSQAGPGIFSFRGSVPRHNMRLPSSPGARKPQVGFRIKAPGNIKIHGPMVDQLPGVMNPKSPKHRFSLQSSQKIDSPIKQFHKMQQAIHIPSPQNTPPSNSGYDKEAKAMLEYNRYRDSHHFEHITPNQVHQFVKIKKKSDIKLEPQDHPQYSGTGSTPNNHNHIVPTVHIHHPASSSFHSLTLADELQVRPNSVEMLTHISDRVMSDNSTRSPSNLTSPSRSDFPMKRFEVSSHQNMGRHSHGQPTRTHIPVGQNQMTPNHLHVSTTSIDESQSALSPLHSPPPLRPAPANQHRSIALRSPPNLTPSTVLSHFDFSPVSTNTVISQPGHLFHQQNNQVIDSNSGHALPLATSNVPLTSISSGHLPTTTTNTVTLTYIPVKTQASDKIVYVPLNQNFNNERHKQQQQQQQQQPILLYSNQRKPNHHFPGQLTDVDSPLSAEHIQSPNDMKIPLSPLELPSEPGHGPYSGITRKFTVRTLQREHGSLPSSLTTVRIQGPNVTDINYHQGETSQTSSFAVSNGDLSSRNDLMSNLGPADNSLGNETGSVITSGGHMNQVSVLSGVKGEHGKADNKTTDLRLPNQSYEDVSDYDEDYEEFYDDNGANYDGEDGTDERKSFGYYRGRKRGKRRFFVRRKGAASHHYKLKYKQALEQAKVMRERRPSFMASNFHPEGLQNYDKQNASNPGANISNRQRDNELEKVPLNSSDVLEESMSFDKNATAIVSKHNSPPQSFDMLAQGPVSNSQTQFSNGFDDNHNNSMADELVHNSSTPVADKRLAPTEAPLADLQNHPGKKTKVEGKVQRRKRKGNAAFENDFFYGQWMLSQDGQIKKKKRNSTSSALSPTQYLADPLEQVKLPPNPETWSEGEVASFIGATECSQYADTLKDQEIDGSALLLLTRESLMEFTGMKLGPALKICGYVAHLKGRLRMHQNVAVIQS